MKTKLHKQRSEKLAKKLKAKENEIELLKETVKLAEHREHEFKTDLVQKHLGMEGNVDSVKEENKTLFYCRLLRLI